MVWNEGASMVGSANDHVDFAVFDQGEAVVTLRMDLVETPLDYF